MTDLGISCISDYIVQVLVGILTQPKEGVWHIEDVTASIAIDLSHSQVIPHVLYI
jgi:hypothetical protein